MTPAIFHCTLSIMKKKNGFTIIELVETETVPVVDTATDATTPASDTTTDPNAPPVLPTE